MSRILLTCGIGDFIAIESHLTAVEREGVEAIHWATRARESLMALVPFVFPNVTEHVVERDVFGEAFSESFSVRGREELPDLDPAVLDWNVRAIADDVWHGRRQYTGSTVTTKLADISRLKLPKYYFVIHPNSANAPTPVRDMTIEEWWHINHIGYSAVIVNSGGERLQPFPSVIDLTDKLTLLEAIEVTKGAEGFIGCASAFSVVAAKVLPEHRLFIKGGPELRKYFHWFYYAPHDGNSFITDDLRKILSEGD